MNRIPLNKIVAPVAIIAIGVVGTILMSLSHASTCLETNLETGSTGECVQHAQQMLNGLSVSWQPLADGVTPRGSQFTASGEFDATTLARVATFQQIELQSDSELKVTGHVDSHTWQRLCTRVAELPDILPSQRIAHRAAATAGCTQ